MADLPEENAEPEKKDLDAEAADETPKGKVNRVVGISVLVLILVVASGIFFSFQFVENERLRALNEWQIRLGIVADSRAAEINEWVEENFNTIAEITENASLQLYMDVLVEAEGDTEKLSDAAAQEGYLRNLLVAIADRNGFAPEAPVQETNSNVERAGIAGIALVGSNSNPIVVTPEMPPLGRLLAPAVAKALDGVPATIDMYKGSTNQPTMGFALPVYGVHQDQGAKGLGVAIGVRVIGDDLFNLLKQPGDTSETSETYLVRKTGNSVEYLSPLRDGTAALQRTMAYETANLAASFALDKPSGFGVKRDYAGEEVLVTSRPIAGLPWVLVRKISRAEALSANESRLQTILVVFILVIVGMTVGMIAVWRHGTSLRAAAAAEKFRISSQRFENISKFMRVISNSQPTHIVAVDGTTTYTYSNDPAAEAAGIETADMMGKTMASVIGPVKAKFYADVNKELLAEFEQAEKDGMENSVQQTRKAYVKRFENEQGELEILKSDHIPLRGDRDYPPGILMVIDDITEFSQEQVKSENRLQQLVATLATVIDDTDDGSTERSTQAGEVARAIAQELECEKTDVDTAEFATTLRYLGTAVSSTEGQEYLTSANLLERVDFEGPVVETIRQSAEMMDGSGPLNLSGDDILLTARIVAVADAFMNQCRPIDSSARLSFEDAGNWLLQNSGTIYDRKVVTALLTHLENKGGVENWSHFLAG